MLVTRRGQRVKYIYIYIYIYTLLARKMQCENRLSDPRIYHNGTSGEGGT